MKKYLPWLITHSFFLLMLMSILWDPHHLRWQFKYSAYFAIGFLCLILSLNPLKVMFPRWVLIHRLNRYRQEIGVAVFSYASIHALCFALKVGSLNKWLSAANNPRFMSVMLVSMPILFILAVTSTQFSKMQLGFKNWKRLHRFVYVAEVGIIVHLAMIGKGMLALLIFLPLILIQLFRLANRNKLQ